MLKFPIVPPDFLNSNAIKDMAKIIEGMPPAAQMAAGMVGAIMALKMMNKLMLVGMKPEQRKKHTRKKAAWKWSRYSVKRWRSGK